MEEPKRFIWEELGQLFNLKETSIGSPEQCLVNKVSKVALTNGVNFWILSSSQHVQAAAKNVEDYRTRANLGKLLNTKSLWPSDYLPKANFSSKLTQTKASYYRSLIEILWQIVDVGIGQLSMQASAIDHMMALLREGHLIMFSILFLSEE